MTEKLLEFYEKDIVVSPKQVVEELLCTDLKSIKEFIVSIPQKTITSYNIPQYSNYNNGTYEMIKYLRMAGDFGPSYLEIGEHFLENSHKKVAYIKYGENHAKLAELLGLVEIKKVDRKRVYLTGIGKEIEKLDVNIQQDCFNKLSCRIPIVQEAIKSNIASANELESHLNNYLSPSTARRRKKNTWVMIEVIRGCEENEF